MNVAAQYLLTPLSLGDSNTAEQVDIANKPRMKEKAWFNGFSNWG